MVAVVQKVIAHKEAIDKAEVPEAPVDRTYPAEVINNHSQSISLESGTIKPGEIGKATQAEVSCLVPHYLELV